MVVAREEGEAEVNGPHDDACSGSGPVRRLGLVEPSPAPVLEEPEEGRGSRWGWKKRSPVNGAVSSGWGRGTTVGKWGRERSPVGKGLDGEEMASRW